MARIKLQGGDRYDWNCMGLNVRLLRMAGGWPRMDRIHLKSEKIYLFYSAFILYAFFMYVLIQVYGLTVYYHTWKSLDAAIEDFIVVVTGLIAFIKMVLVMRNQRQLQLLIDYLNLDLNPRHLTNPSHRTVLQDCVRHEKKLTKAYLSFAYCITVLYLTSSVSRILRQRSHKLPLGTATLPLKYPFYLEESAWYLLAYLHQFMVMLVNGQVGVVTDSFFSCLVYYICGHFRVVAEKMKASQHQIPDKETVNYHLEVLRCVDKIQTIFGVFLTLQLSLTAFLICLAVFQITQIEDIKPIHYIKCLIYLVIKMTQLLLYCWYGQEVTHRSFQVSTAVYMSEWYEHLGKRSLSNLKIAIQRSQEPIVMYAGIFFNLSLKTFGTVMHTAYTCFTLLNIMESGK